MQRFTTLLALTASAVLATGCGAFDTKKKGRKAEQTPVELAGTWVSPCLDADWFGFTQSQETFTFSAVGDFDKTTRMYSDDCATETAEVTVRGTSDVVGAAEGIDGGKNLNLTVSEASLTPKTEAAVKAMNAVSYCGYGDWQLGQAKDVIGKDCAGESYALGEVVFDVYKIEDDKAFFGKSGLIFFDKSNVNERPAELDRKRVFQKR